MFNEAFWLFYMIGLSDMIRGNAFAIALLLGLIGGIGITFVWTEVCEKTGKRLTWLLGIFCTVLMVAGVFMPSKEALYAGAGQYVAEATELDDTLRSLKTLLDQKIEALIEE